MFLVCGEALFDVFIGGGSNRALHLDAHPGGSPFNVAIGLARLGQPESFLGGIARDMLGDRLVGVLEAEGVGTATVARFAAEAAAITCSRRGADLSRRAELGPA